MVRKVSVFLLLAVVLVFAGLADCAEAARGTFADAFSVDVPSGWQVEEEIEDDIAQFNFTAPDGSARVTIIVGENEEGFTAADVAVGMAESLGGSEPEEDEDGDFLFTFTSEDGLDGVAFVSVDEETILTFLKIGDHPQMDGFLGSFESVE